MFRHHPYFLPLASAASASGPDHRGMECGAIPSPVAKASMRSRGWRGRGFGAAPPCSVVWESQGVSLRDVTVGQPMLTHYRDGPPGEGLTPTIRDRANECGAGEIEVGHVTGWSCASRLTFRSQFLPC